MRLVSQKLLISLIGKCTYLKESTDPFICTIHWGFCVHNDVTLMYMNKHPSPTRKVDQYIFGAARFCSACALCLCQYYLKLLRPTPTVHITHLTVDITHRIIIIQTQGFNQWLSASVFKWMNASFCGRSLPLNKSLQIHISHVELKSPSVLTRLSYMSFSC